jgi:hypothetical protein
MAYDFPASPAENDEFVPPVGGQTYIYKAPRWLVKGIPPTGGGSGGTGIGEAPEDGQQYGRQDADWTVVEPGVSDWSEITGKPATFPPTLPIAWTDVSGKPTTFPPSTHNHPQSEVTNLVTDLAAKAPLASPALTGNPTAPTATAGDNDTSIATTAFVTGGIATAAALKVAKAGDTMTGDLTISKATPAFILNKAAAGQSNNLVGQKGNLNRWSMEFGNTTSEAGSNAGSDFTLNRFSDAGAYIDSPLVIVRSTGALNFTAVPTVNYQQMPALANVADAAPSSPLNGQLWFKSDSGNTFIWYDDGSSQQWVQVNAAPLNPDPPTAQAQNRIVNGAMQHSQENGDTASASAVSNSGYYPADQWPAFWSTSGTCNAGRYSDSAAFMQTPYRVQVNVITTTPSPAAGNYLQLCQMIEGQNVADLKWGTAAAKPVVMRFTALATAGTYTLMLKNSASDRTYLANFTVAATAVAQTFTIAIPGDTSGTWLTSNGIGVLIGFGLITGTTFGGGTNNAWNAGNKIQASGASNLGATANNYFAVSDVGFYLDPDNTGLAPKWEMPDYAEELQACQRYYAKDIIMLFSGNVTNAGGYYALTPHPVTMRATPTLSANSNIGNTSFPATVGTLINLSNAIREGRTANATAGGAFTSGVIASARM